ncbi:MAG: SDR family oxidoreductase [Chloroflexi bacterium]|nr:SDR family oxidoreductase [Chloroflexota bacterium]
MTTRDSHMKGKICMVTGATSGIGLATAKELAGQGATVILTARNPEKGESTVDRIQRETGNSSVEFMLADLSIQAQIRDLAREFQNRYSRLDVLVNNAGAIFLKRQLSAEGVEFTFATNYINYFLLTNLLLDTLKASAPSRIVNVSSDMQKNAKIDFDDLQAERKYSSFGAYGQSKLAIILFTYELARRLEGTQVTVNAVHPGFAASNIGKNNGWLGKIVVPMLKPFAMSPAKAAETSIYLASSPEVEGTTGKYFMKKSKSVPSSPITYDEAAAQRLWEISTQMTGI